MENNIKNIFSNNITFILLKNHFLVINDVKDKIDNTNNSNLVLAIVNSFLSLGYKLDDSSIELLSKCDSEELTRFYFANVTIMKQIKGCYPHIIFYKNFPNLENVSKFEYIARANLHYFTASTSDYGFMNEDITSDDNEKEEDNDGEIKNPHFDELKILTMSNAIIYLREYITNLFLANTAINRDLYDAIKDFRLDYKLSYIEEIPFKENIAVYAYTKASNKIIGKEELKYALTVTDVLRIYYMLSNKEPIFSGNKFISLKRQCRRNILSRLEAIVKSKGSISNAINDFYLHEELWKTAFNYLHVFEFKEQYKCMYEIADIIRNGKSLSFFANLEKLKDNQIDYLNLLSTKPGEFARKLNYLLTNPKYDNNLTLEYFKNIASQVSTKLLLEIYCYFNNRDNLDYRLFKIPTAYSFKYYEREAKLVPLDMTLINNIISIIKNALEEKFSNYERLEDVYVDENLKNYVIPPIIRNSSLNFDDLLYGCRIKLKDSNYLRVFTTWKNEKDTRIDIDLAVEMFDDNFKQIGCLAWHNMEGGRFIDAYHSGDLISAPLPFGATEFVNINLLKARKRVRYLVVTNTMFSGLTFKELSYCYSGVMLSDEKMKRLYDEKAVFIKSKLNQDKALQNIAFIIDLLNLELIWVDMPYDSYYGSVTYESLGVRSVLVDAVKERMNVYDFIMLHKQHITFVDDPKKAKILISNTSDATINPLNFEKFSKDFF